MGIRKRVYKPQWNQRVMLKICVRERESFQRKGWKRKTKILNGG